MPDEWWVLSFLMIINRIVYDKEIYIFFYFKISFIQRYLKKHNYTCQKIFHPGRLFHN